jgi:Arc/MetJ-type ribon-helix-helix transcriptional regulator
MTIHLPKDVESSINAEVLSGHFASADDAIAAAWRAFQRQQRQERPATAPSGQGLIGALREDADLLDQAVAHAMTVREERPWRVPPGE